MNILKLTALAVALASAGAGQALTSTHNTNVIALQTTNFSGFLNFTKFNPSLGTLNSIKIDLFGNIAGGARAESLDGAPSTIVLNLSGMITLTRPDNTVLVVTTPLVANSFGASAFDGTVDFGGTSGVTFAGLSASDMDTVTLLSAVDFALFTGLGTISAPLSAMGNSFGGGSGNLITQFNLQAGASGSVTYDYTVAGVPEPATWGLLIVGFAMTGFASRRRVLQTVAA